MKAAISSVLTVVLCACASSPKEIDPDAFVSFFAKQQTCLNFVSLLFQDDSRGDLSRSTLDEIRSRLSINEPPLSDVIGRTQLASKDRAYDFLDRRDQGEVGGKVFDAMEELPGFRASQCEVNVKEYFMVYLYERVGGDDSVASRQLETYGLEDSTAKKWALMSYVLTGKLKEPADSPRAGAR